MYNQLTKYFEITRNLNMSREELENYQFKKLKQIITYSYENTAFYNSLMKKNSIHPNDIKKLADITKLPIVTKQDIQKTQIENFLNPKNSKEIISVER